ncbi:unnamed protein product [Linum tenue]|uniref:FAS1 domain-containing protein n=2 Tax=Linum tenue TaxID=586396 RepID=A0AAV0GU28_9ROSI|nr:unnamed protein product [Linum tenue]
METLNWLFLAVVSLLTFSSQRASAGDFNITEILDNYSDYSQFNDLLSRTRVANRINGQGTVTVLVVNNGAAGSLSGQSNETIKAVLKLHVILDFLNMQKIRNLKQRSATYTNMYQTTGDANAYQGMTNMTKNVGDSNDQIMFGNGRRNANLTVSLQKVVSTVMAPGGWVSVIEVSGLIEPDWVFNLKASPPKKAPSPGPSDAPAPSRRHRKEAPESAESAEDYSPPEPDADDESSDSPAPAPAPGGPKSAASSPSAAPAAAFAAVLVGLLAFKLGF